MSKTHPNQNQLRAKWLGHADARQVFDLPLKPDEDLAV
jgi:hypothetical protein